MKKRGEFSNLASLVMLVVFALLMLFFIGRSVVMASSQSAETACSQSIIKSGLDKVPNFDCKAERITISKASLESKAGGKLDADGLDYAVKRAIADEMYACWKMTGKGLVDPYKESFESAEQSDLLGSRDFFLICKIVTLKDIPDFNGLLYWTAFNKPKGEDEPYFDIVYNKKPTKEEIKEFEKKEDTYSSEKRYCVVWRFIYPYGYKNPLQSVIFVPYSELIQTTYKPYYGNGFFTELAKEGTNYLPILMN